MSRIVCSTNLGPWFPPVVHVPFCNVIDEDIECTICIGNIPVEGLWCVLNCGYTFCLECVYDVALGLSTRHGQQNCPNCRKEGSMARNANTMICKIDKGGERLRTKQFEVGKILDHKLHEDENLLDNVEYVTTFAQLVTKLPRIPKLLKAHGEKEITRLESEIIQWFNWKNTIRINHDKTEDLLLSIPNRICELQEQLEAPPPGLADRELIEYEAYRINRIEDMKDAALTHRQYLQKDNDRLDECDYNIGKIGARIRVLKGKPPAVKVIIGKNPPQPTPVSNNTAGIYHEDMMQVE